MFFFLPLVIVATKFLIQPINKIREVLHDMKAMTISTKLEGNVRDPLSSVFSQFDKLSRVFEKPGIQNGFHMRIHLWVFLFFRQSDRMELPNGCVLVEVQCCLMTTFCSLSFSCCGSGIYHHQGASSESAIHFKYVIGYTLS